MEKIKELLLALNNAIDTGLITCQQRKLLIEKILNNKFQSINDFEGTFNRYFEECINATLEGSSYMPSLCEDINTNYIKELL